MTYNEFIQGIITSRGQWNISDDEYFESHHIIPLCVGGAGEVRNGRKREKHQNIIFLYPEEHYHAHKLLALENPQNPKLVLAWEMMAHPKGKTKREYEVSEEDYAILKALWSKQMQEHNNFLDENGHPWSYGIPMSEEQKTKLSEAKRGVKLGSNTEETKKKKSKATKERYLLHPETFKSGTSGKICITNGITNTYIYENESLPDGFVRGQTRHSNNENYVKLWTDDKKRMWSEKFSGSNNPMYGNGYKLSGGNNGHAIYIYTYLNVDYQCRDDLMKVLTVQFPTISESTIRNIMRGTYTSRISSKYQYVIDNLSWRLKNEN